MAHYRISEDDCKVIAAPPFLLTTIEDYAMFFEAESSFKAPPSSVLFQAGLLKQTGVRSPPWNGFLSCIFFVDLSSAGSSHPMGRVVVFAHLCFFVMRYFQESHPEPTTNDFNKS